MNDAQPKQTRWFQFGMRWMLILPLLAAIPAWRYAQYLARWENPNPQDEYVALDWDVETGKNVKWTVPLGSQTWPGVRVASGKVFIGSNNQQGYLPRFPKTQDAGVMLCFNADDGKFLWQATSEKLPTGRVNDWPLQGVCSVPLVMGDRLYYTTNRCEVVCLDTEGFHDNENDGPTTNEKHTGRREADVVWSLDMIKTLGVFPHNMTCSSPVSDGTRLFLVTGNGLDETHLNLPRPAAPSFICLDRNTGKLLWRDNSPGANILHGSWGSPTYAVIQGVPQVIFPGGDGWLYSFDPQGNGKGGSKLLWKFDSNPKDSKWILGGRGTRNNIIATPVVYDQKVYIAVGQDPEHGEGDGHLWCIDPIGRGDISPVQVFHQDDLTTPLPHKRLLACVPEDGEVIKPNPNSGVVWHFDKFDFNNDGDIDFDETFHRTLATVAIKNDVLIVNDLSGLVHCFDAQTGKRQWLYDAYANIWASPIILGDHVYIGNDDGDMLVFGVSKDPTKAMHLNEPLGRMYMNDPIYSTPTAANEVLYIATRRRLFAIQEGIVPPPAPQSKQSTTAGP